MSVQVQSLSRKSTNFVKCLSRLCPLSKAWTEVGHSDPEFVQILSNKILCHYNRMDRVWTNFGLGQSLDKLWTWTKPGIYQTYQIFEIGQSLDKLWTWTKSGQTLDLDKVWTNFRLWNALDWMRHRMSWACRVRKLTASSYLIKSTGTCSEHDWYPC